MQNGSKHSAETCAKLSGPQSLSKRILVAEGILRSASDQTGIPPDELLAWGQQLRLEKALRRSIARWRPGLRGHRVHARRPRSLEDFEASCEKTPEGCWLPIGRGAKQLYAKTYRLAHGEPPEGTELDHLCGTRTDGRRCCNPDHFEPVTHSENKRRGGEPHFHLRGTSAAPKSGQLCLCGCGGETRSGSHFIGRHHLKLLNVVGNDRRRSFKNSAPTAAG